MGDPDKKTEDVVKDDQRMSAIAAKNKRKDYMALYEAQPEEFRDTRPNPEILMPGDKVVLPAVEAPRHPSADKKKAKFVDGTLPPELRLHLQVAGKPFANKTLKFTVTKINLDRMAKPPDPASVTTDADGLTKFNVDVGVLEAELSCDDPKWKMKLLIGKLRPVHEPGGVEQRMSNLGYHVPMPPVGFPAGSDAEKKANLAHEETRQKKAARLQDDKGIRPVIGKVDGDFRKALIKLHEPAGGK